MPKYSEPLRLRIQKKIIAEIETICPENGYINDLRPKPDDEKVPKRVFRGRFWYGDKDPLPMVGMLQVPLQPEQDSGKGGGNPSKTGPVDFVLQGWTQDDFDNPTDPAEILLADVEACLAKCRARYTEGSVLGFKSLIEIRISEGVVRPPDEISAKAYFWLPITLVIARNLADPYNDD